MEEFKLLFVDMGQGDCAIIRCPDGNVVMVDCGCSANLEVAAFDKAKNTLNALLQGNPLHSLILTHPDRDHYNQVANMLYNHKTNTFLAVNQIAFSMSYDNKNPLRWYSENSVCGYVSAGYFGRPKLVEVTLNTGIKQSKTWDPQSLNPVPVTATLANGRYPIISGITSANEKWAISIIAGNVPPYNQSDADKTNSASLVTLIEFDDKKILLTGDATSSTQDYLFTAHQNSIANLELFQIPHHGSAECDSTPAFRTLVDPENLYVSVGILNDTFHLPRYSVLNNWSSCLNLRTSSLEIDYWKSKEDMANPLNF